MLEIVMEYRAFGRMDYRVSALGFGCMRLPTLGKPEEIDEPAAIEMIRWAIDQGVNYCDSAYVYHGGNSERVLGKALEGGYRSKTAIATKMPVWLVQQPGDFDRLFEEQLERLRTKRIDFYLMHNLQAGSWPKVRELGAVAWMERMKAKGLIGHVGFSFHDKFDALKDILGDYSGWEFCQIQYNYVNEDVQAGTKGLEYLGARGLGVVIMEPLFGGTLANPPEAVRQVWDEAPGKPDPVDMALQWVWNKPQVSVVLSGMGKMAEVKQNVASACRSGVGRMTKEELALIGRVAKKYQELSPVPCTRCGYCMPCPNGVAIPQNFELYNNAQVFKGSTATLNRILYTSLAEGSRADKCVECGACEEQCPQQIAIRTWLRKVHAAMAAKAG